MRAFVPSRAVLAILAFAALTVLAHDADPPSRHPRQLLGGVTETDTSSTDTNTKTTATSTTAAATTTTSAQNTQTTTANTQTTTSAANTQTTNTANTNTNTNTQTTQTTAAQTTTSANQPSNTQTTQATTKASTNAPPQATTSSSQVITTNAEGQTETSVVIVTYTPSASSSSASSSSTAASDNSGSGSSGTSTSTIIGLSVAGGVALIGVIAFFVWKFTHKRFSDLDDNEAIKWPELNAHNDDYPLPAARAPYADSTTDLGRANSRGGAYAPSIGATSTSELYPASASTDPYAVPPLPHLNPNQPAHVQPYMDDPSAAFYDPYRGPVPQTFNDPNQVVAMGGIPGEAIPMTQLGAGAMAMGGMPNGGRNSPGPGMMAGRRSPGPQAPFAFGEGGGSIRTASPAPPAYGGVDRARSPGPAAAYGPR
ncbi:uncharacterized protein STEHIDRAFT_144763 [Stereum hirsutum FP-91666 SS1]|uniref:uncharacterized protein n=1 Tax=Stereum hirsutum (strain FP-91666) TaxID=721885 RepID=UPI000440EDC8|nr:uncharacterized protein STEHIDRAFT_144763 [Stereum hirsutum FP-91666 SS1]EIM91512.1 hypothetical protein STEHIDRAFT_144763 [Stereum hirsutum FP-91666 SS1]